MIIVADAPVAIKWFVAEDGHEAAACYLDPAYRIVAPDLIRIELANVFWKKARRGEIDRAQATAVLENLDDMFEWLEPSALYLRVAMDAAFLLDHPVYDCVYLAVSRSLGAPLVTADARPSRKVDGVWRGAVHYFTPLLEASESDGAVDGLEPLLADLTRLTAQVHNTVHRFGEAFEGDIDRLRDRDALSSGSSSATRLTSMVEALPREDKVLLLAACLLGAGIKATLPEAVADARLVLAGARTGAGAHIVRYLVHLPQGMAQIAPSRLHTH